MEHLGAEVAAGAVRRCLAALAIWGVTALPAFAGPPESDFRPYVQVRVGPTVFTDPEAPPTLELKSPAVHPTFGATLGADFGRILGFEVAADHAKTELHSDADGKLGDWTLTTLVAQARVRFPTEGRFVPYLVAGGGVGLGEFSGRENFGVDVGGSDVVPLAALGIGAEYMIDSNIAIGVEARHLFWFEPEARVGAGHETLSADNVTLSAGLRVYFDNLGGALAGRGPDTPPARDSDETRGYVALRAGQAIFTDGVGGEPGVDRTSGILGALAFGLNFNRHIGAEIASEYTRAQVRSDSLGKVSGHPIWTALALLRLRYPVWEDRMSPYLLVGGGVGSSVGGGDRDQPFQVTGFEGPAMTTGVAALGAGVDYFLEQNVALTVEAKHTFLFDNDVTYAGRPAQLDLDFVSLTGGLRLLFP